MEYLPIRSAIPTLPYHTIHLPHTPYTHKTLLPILPHISGAIFGKFPIYIYLV